MKWIRKHKKICMGIGILLVLVLVWGITRIGREQGDDTAQEETAAIEKRTLVKSISATGTFVSSEEEQVSSKAVGVEVMQLRVEVGDRVTAGDVIAVLDSEDLGKDLADARDSLNRTKDQAQRSRESAQRNLDRAVTDRDDALADVDKDIAEAYEEWQTAQKNYQDSAAAYQEAKAMLGSMSGTADSAYVQASDRVSTLKRQMESDKRTEDRLKKNYEQQKAQRENRIRQIWDSYNNQVDAYQDTIDNTEDAGELQQEQVDDLQEQYDDTVVRAPVSGLITAVNLQVGDTYNGGTIAVINNVDSFDVTTEIDEYDINMIREGQEVVIKTNATGEDELQGVVEKVAPMATGSVDSGSLSSGSFGGLDFGNLMSGSGSSLMGGGGDDVTFTVRIRVITEDARIRIGMTAKLSIIEQKNENVLSVPYNAVLSDDDGKTFYVNKITGTNEDGTYQTKKVWVEKGIESDYYTEIINAKVKEGDEILLPKAEGENSLELLINTSGSMGGI